MKEFNKWFKISFEFKGTLIEHIILIDKVTRDEEYREWEYTFSHNIKGTDYNFSVNGDIDDDNNIRTSGECYINGEDVCPRFYIYAISEDGMEDDIDDIDIIDCD